MRSQSELLEHIKDIKGYLRDKEAYFLYSKALKCREGAIIVEIGSYCGKSTICLALGLKDSNNIKAKVYAIDPFDGPSEHGYDDIYETFKKNIHDAGVKEFIVPYKGASVNANKEWGVSKKIDLLWIDGAHEFEYVYDDIKLWLKHVANEGYIALHDTSGRFMYDGFLGVRRVVKEEMFPRECLKDFSFASTITCARKATSVNQDEAWKRWKSYQCWWIGKPEYYDKCDGVSGLLKLLVLIAIMNYKRIPKMIRKPWQRSG